MLRTKPRREGLRSPRRLAIGAALACVWGLPSSALGTTCREVDPLPLLRAEQRRIAGLTGRDAECLRQETDAIEDIVERASATLSQCLRAEAGLCESRTCDLETAERVADLRQLRERGGEALQQAVRCRATPQEPPREEPETLPQETPREQPTEPEVVYRPSRVQWFDVQFRARRPTFIMALGGGLSVGTGATSLFLSRRPLPGAAPTASVSIGVRAGVVEVSTLLDNRFDTREVQTASVLGAVSVRVFTHSPDGSRRWWWGLNVGVTGGAVAMFARAATCPPTVSVGRGTDCLQWGASLGYLASLTARLGDWYGLRLTWRQPVVGFADDSFDTPTLEFGVVAVAGQL